MSALGAIQYLKGNYTEAANLQRQVLENLSQLKGEQNMFTISAIADLSPTYYGQDIIEEFKQLLIQALEGTRENLGAEHPSTFDWERSSFSLLPTKRLVRGRSPIQPSLRNQDGNTRNWKPVYVGNHGKYSARHTLS